MKHASLKNLVLSAMFLAIGLVLPFFIGQIPAVGKMLLPMHIPVLLCGLICGWQWGLGGSVFTWQLFIGGAVLNALPGIALQLILIPAVMVLLDRTKLVRFYQPQPLPEQTV